jgi:hypothetical protein
MSRSRIWNVVLAVSLVLNLALVASVVGLMASGPIADRIAPRLHLASGSDVEDARNEGAEAKERIGSLPVTSPWSWEARGATVSDALDDVDSRVSDLDDRLADVEDEVGSSAGFLDLGPGDSQAGNGARRDRLRESYRPLSRRRVTVAFRVET